MVCLTVFFFFRVSLSKAYFQCYSTVTTNCSHRYHDSNNKIFICVSCCDYLDNFSQILTKRRWWLLRCSAQAPPPHCGVKRNCGKWVGGEPKSGTTTTSTFGIFLHCSFFFTYPCWSPSVMSPGAQCFFVHHRLLLSLLLQHLKLLLQDLHHHGWVGCQVGDIQTVCRDKKQMLSAQRTRRLEKNNRQPLDCWDALPNVESANNSSNTSNTKSLLFSLKNSLVCWYFAMQIRPGPSLT